MKISFLTLFSFFLAFTISAQDPLRFQSEIDQLILKNGAKKQDRPIVFVGSSSFRFWTTIQKDLDNELIINNGFGGSHFSDLIYFLDPLILDLNPRALYIYEGDNDLADGKNPEQIVYQASQMIKLIKGQIPDLKIFLVSAKPSISRWKKKPSYLRFNMYLKEYCVETDDVAFIDVWRAMLGENGQPNPTLFIEDDLHMNDKGYKIWTEKIKPTLNGL
ncbi:MAG: lysophospholipase L1-like esterase [Cyclobacteriaceae bacterium]|jgi:lysophospholipase L1-like esterase